VELEGERKGMILERESDDDKGDTAMGAPFFVD